MAKKEKQEYNLVTPQVTPVFIKNMECKYPIVVNRGGAGSGKTHALCQLMVYKFLTEKNKKFLLARKSLPSLRMSVLLYLERVFDDFGVNDRIKFEKVMLNYKFNNNLMHLGSVDDPNKIKSQEFNYIWLEEATDFTYEDYQLIRGRLRAPITDGKMNQMFLSFNPIDESHWIKTELLEKHDDVIEIHSTYKDNPFLPEEAIDFYEKAIDYDINYYRVYALGEWGKLEDLVYSPSMWNIIKTFPDTFSNDIYGLDFGFNAPSSLVHGVYKEREVWIEELIHRKDLTNTQLIEEMKKAIPENKRNRPIYADSAEPDRIKEIRQAGFNCKTALKDVKNGIDFVKRMKMHITEDSSELIKELKGYSYKKDTKRNLILDEPIPYADHGCDSCRYMIFTHLHNIATYRVRWL